MNEHDDRLRELGTQLPYDQPDPARRDAVRSALLVAAAEGDARRPAARWYIVGGAFAAGALAAAALFFIVRPVEKPTLAPSAARIDASPAAQFDRQVTRTPTGTDEVVRLHAGTLNVAVGALRAGDHVRVATRDAEVEGEGAYAVAVIGDQLRDVTVADGHATIRITGEQVVFLSSGQAWHASGGIVARADMSPVPAPADIASASAPAAPAPAASAPTVPTPPAPIRVAPAVSAHVSTSGPTERQPIEVAAKPTDELPASAITAAAPDAAASPPSVAPVQQPAPMPAGAKEVETRFQAGMSLLKAGKSAEAARELIAAADAGGDDPLAADARYFAAVALTKAGRKTEAEEQLIAFLDHAPHSIRRGRAGVMLGRLIAERGDAKSARAWFESALIDPDASVVAAARAGIAALK